MASIPDDDRKPYGRLTQCQSIQENDHR
jgi:hypothetical protein